ncbi:nucleotidyl transferase AbiEii/AbiGii toxin family protein [Candidatus Gottesmanbacteria bacterium]|nr:nucleotidyl transferase AbiEii/AbiGii toxin family protein [Candidatus Gottesmanbacteria bacterium]
MTKRQLKSFSVRTAGNGRQIFLQFPVLKSLGLATQNDSDILFLRLDLAPIDSNFYTEEVSVKTAKKLSFIVKRYSLPDLFASKIAVILKRTFKKGKNNLITFKGRDYFDLIWFSEKGIVPNYKRLENIVGKSKKEVLAELKNKVSLIKPEYLQEDLNPLFSDQKFVTDFCKNFKNLYKGLQIKN